MKKLSLDHAEHARLLAPALLSALLVAAWGLSAAMPHETNAAPQREHLTPEEIEMVRDNQELDKRIGVFIKAAERRFLAVTEPSSATGAATTTVAARPLVAKDAVKWGEVKGTRTQLLSDYARILDEAITNIDDTAVRSPTSPLLKKSLNKLAEASRRFLPPLAALRDAAQDETEREALERAIERTQEIIEAAQKHPSSEQEEKQKDGKKKGGV
jgi:hypothetical protein